MSAPAPLPPGVIPYVEHHTGPRRVVTVELTSNGMVTGQLSPCVGIDGRRFLVPWGRVAFEVPADRPVHLSAHVEADRVGQVASVLLPPGGAPVLYRYATHVGGGFGSLTPAG